MIYIMLSEILIGMVFLFILYFTDRIITQKRLRKNQIAWDNYCKDMTFSERLDCFNDWLPQRRYEEGWGFYYIPLMNHIEPTVFDCKINGIKYRGTKEEILKESGLPAWMFDEIRCVPMMLEIK